MGDAARRRRLGLTTPKNLRPKTPAASGHAEQRLCLMSQAGRCSTSFHVLGDDGRFMCQEHWRHVDEGLRIKLAEEFVTIKAAHTAWVQVQRAAILRVMEAKGLSKD